MFIFILSLIVSIPSFADSFECNNLTKKPTDDFEFTKDFKIGDNTYSIRKGPQYCYIDAKINKTYVMLEGCDSVIANPTTSEVSCVQGKETVKLGQSDLTQMLSKKQKEFSSSSPFVFDQCTDFLNQDDRLINTPRSLNGNIEIMKSSIPGGRCIIKNDGKRVECDEVYQLSGNKVECVHGYISSKVTGTLSNGTTLSLSDLLESKLNLCGKMGTFQFQNMQSEVYPNDPKTLDIRQCKLLGENERSCSAIWLTETGLDCQPMDGHKNCEPTKDNQKPCELIKISKAMRADIYTQVLGDQNITVKKIRELIRDKLFVPKNPDFFDDTTLKGQPSIQRMGSKRKTSQ